MSRFFDHGETRKDEEGQTAISLHYDFFVLLGFFFLISFRFYQHIIIHVVFINTTLVQSQLATERVNHRLSIISISISISIPSFCYMYIFLGFYIIWFCSYRLQYLFLIASFRLCSKGEKRYKLTPRPRGWHRQHLRVILFLQCRFLFSSLSKLDHCMEELWIEAVQSCWCDKFCGKLLVRWSQQYLDTRSNPTLAGDAKMWGGWRWSMLVTPSRSWDPFLSLCSHCDIWKVLSSSRSLTFDLNLRLAIITSYVTQCKTKGVVASAQS